MATPKLKHKSLDTGISIVAAGFNEIQSAHDFLGVVPAANTSFELEPGNVTPTAQLLIEDVSGTYRVTVVSVDSNGDTAIQEYLIISTGEGADGSYPIFQEGVVGFLSTLVDTVGDNLYVVSAHTARTAHRVYLTPLVRPAVPEPAPAPSSSSSSSSSSGP